MDYIKINKKLWDNKTEIHFKSDFYDVESFIQGKDSLNQIELALLDDVKGKKILHLQCHFGLDTISLSRHGAVSTGVDFSEKSIIKANQLRDTLGTNTSFIQSDIYKLADVLNEKFDIVYTSYGVLGWLPDMEKWADTVFHFLNPGGRLILIEFHPVVWMFSYDFRHIEFNYMDPLPIVEEKKGTYTDKDAPVQDRSVSWNHGLAKVIDSIIKAGLTLKDFQEHNYSPYDCFENTVRIAERKFQIKGLENKIPLIYSAIATKE